MSSSTEDFLEAWPKELIGEPVAQTTAGAVRTRQCPLARPWLATFKMGLLLVTTLAIAPLIWYQNEIGAAWYVGALLVIHVIGLVAFAKGTHHRTTQTSKRGWIIRWVGVLILLSLLGLVTKGLTDPASSAIFWGTLGLIWLVHTLGVVILHLRGKSITQSDSLCPFL